MKSLVCTLLALAAKIAGRLPILNRLSLYFERLSCLGLLAVALRHRVALLDHNDMEVRSSALTANVKRALQRFIFPLAATYFACRHDWLCYGLLVSTAWFSLQTYRQIPNHRD
ncbi:MAG: hypothetical protein JSS32_05985 [Verrucomicrobia bacterium]|nr:hypothetical protein [Verrucomicrobiota bacterium]